LFYDFINAQITARPPQIEFSLINDYFPQKFNVLGKMYHDFAAAVNTNSVSGYISNLQGIFYNPYHYYIMQSLRNSVNRNIYKAVDGISELGINKRFFYAIEGKQITDEQREFISQNYASPLLYGSKYHFNLTSTINRQIRNDFKKKEKQGKLYNGLHLEKFSPICETWEFQIGKEYTMPQPALDIDFSKRKLNENARQRILAVRGYDTLTKYYHILNDGNKSSDKEWFNVPTELVKYAKGIAATPQGLGACIHDLDLIMASIT